MGLRTGLIIGTTSFLLGTLAMHWTADHLILWQSPVTYDSVVTAYTYYKDTMVEMPSIFSKFLHAVGAAGLVYYHKIAPSLAALPLKAPSSGAAAVNARDAVFAPLREIATSHTVLAVALVGVILLQSGQYYSERLEERERIEEDEARLRRRQRRREQEEKRKLQTTASTQS
ncbi:hypothetical protein PHSY_002415 [Pseudozyma hubeiensis SY62]|uniref:Uncharacterized protein n=1 Tax=Pseudozyma hubeiensis (strain SY62) TaxID=1305764 RepID=R9P181_PSEHS|nr:hypothetical protein PHSY_002415 [Pseudozyma hubeiensis SY62]GAC94842.1 hypothetical protein PHSY_002415 [Pseudozyma hubeiensis SY62]